MKYILIYHESAISQAWTYEFANFMSQVLCELLLFMTHTIVDVFSWTICDVSDKKSYDKCLRFKHV